MASETRHVLAVVDHADPQPQHLGAVLVPDLLGLDDVAQALRHLAAVGVHREAVRDHLPVGRRVVRAHADQQRRVEPAAVLVAALQVHVGRPAQPFAALQHGRVRRARVEPDVEDVRLLAERAAAALRAAEALGQQRRGVAVVPGVGALALEHVRHAPRQLRTEQGLAAALAVERGDGHAPQALARDAPVGTGLDHVVDAVASPGRVPRALSASMAFERSPAQVALPSSAMNHCGVARKMIGFLQRQQSG